MNCEEEGVEIRMEDYKYAVSYTRATQRAIERGIEWKLTFAQYKQIRKSKTCFYTGVKLTTPPPPKQGQTHPPTMATIDRIDHRKGYEVGNVVACSYYANLAKAQLENPGFLPELGTGLDIAEKMRIFYSIMKKLKDMDFI